MRPYFNLLIFGHGSNPRIDLLMIFLINTLPERELLNRKDRNGRITNPKSLRFPCFMIQFKNWHATITGACVQFEPILCELDPVYWGRVKLVVGDFFPGVVCLLEDGHLVAEAADPNEITETDVCPCYAPDWSLIPAFITLVRSEFAGFGEYFAVFFRVDLDIALRICYC